MVWWASKKASKQETERSKYASRNPPLFWTPHAANIAKNAKYTTFEREILQNCCLTGVDPHHTSLPKGPKPGFTALIAGPESVPRNHYKQRSKRHRRESRHIKGTKFSLIKPRMGSNSLPTIYICAVELKTGPIFAFSSVKNWSKFLFFLFLKISFSLQKEEDKKTKTKTNKRKKSNISSVKNWSNFVAQHAWTSF